VTETTLERRTIEAQQTSVGQSAGCAAAWRAARRAVLFKYLILHSKYNVVISHHGCYLSVT